MAASLKALDAKDPDVDDLLWDHIFEQEDEVELRVATVRVLAGRAGLVGREALVRPDPDPSLQRDTVQLLRQMSDPRATRLLGTIALSADPIPIRIDAIRAIGSKGPHGLPILVKLLDEPSTPVLDAVVAEIAALGPAAVPALRPLLDADDEAVVFAATRALARMGDPVGLDLLASRFSDNRSTVRLLIELGKPGLLALCRACSWSDCADKELVVKALAKNMPLIEDELCSYVVQPPGGGDADSWAVEALARADTPRARRALLDALADRSAYAGIRFLIAHSFGETRCREAISQLEACLSDAGEEEEVREACQEALKEIRSAGAGTR